MKTKASKELELKIPADLRKAIVANSKAKVQWDDLTPIARRDFISWIDSAKQAKTRARRIEIACSKLVAGKRRPCCYAVVPMGLYKALGANSKAKVVWSTLTSNERRDFADWVSSAKQPQENKRRIDLVCSKLVAGKRHI